MSDLPNATEAQAERAIIILKNAIEAAENGNQAGENFVLAAAHGERLLKALADIAATARGNGPYSRDRDSDTLAAIERHANFRIEQTFAGAS